MVGCPIPCSYLAFWGQEKSIFPKELETKYYNGVKLYFSHAKIFPMSSYGFNRVRENATDIFKVILPSLSTQERGQKSSICFNDFSELGEHCQHLQSQGRVGECIFIFLSCVLEARKINISRGIGDKVSQTRFNDFSELSPGLPHVHPSFQHFLQYFSPWKSWTPTCTLYFTPPFWHLSAWESWMPICAENSIPLLSSHTSQCIGVLDTHLCRGSYPLAFLTPLSAWESKMHMCTHFSSIFSTPFSAWESWTPTCTVYFIPPFLYLFAWESRMSICMCRGLNTSNLFWHLLVHCVGVLDSHKHTHLSSTFLAPF